MEKTMKLLNWIKSLFGASSYQGELDKFVTSKHPSTTAEVEHWIKVYDQHQHKSWQA
jgi:hypothetical protein